MAEEGQTRTLIGNEVQLMEKERPASAAGKKESQFEDHQKKPPAVYYDPLFYEGDSDAEDDFMEPNKIIEWGCDNPENRTIEAAGDKRRCLEVCVCDKFQHVAGFRGLPVFVLFKVKVRLDERHKNTRPFVGRKLYGEIVSNVNMSLDMFNPRPVLYYRGSELITLNSENNSTLLPLSGPNSGKPPFVKGNNFGLVFAFKLDDDGRDVFTTLAFDHQNPKLFEDSGGHCKAEALFMAPIEERPSRKHGTFISRNVIGQPGYDRIVFGAYYSAYYAAWASVEVKMLKKSVSKIHGVVMARSCIFKRRFRLLENEEGSEVDKKSRLVKLTRSMVAVPAYSSLIIGAALYDHENGKLICRDRVCFPAKESGEETEYIKCKNHRALQVTVRWESR